MHALILTDSTSPLVRIKIKGKKVEEGVDKEQRCRDCGDGEASSRLQSRQGSGYVCVVPHGQFPAYETTASKTTALQCCGDEHGMFLSHGNGRLVLQSGNLGAGAMWVIAPTPNKGFVTIQCCDGEQGFCLEHVEGQLHMTCNRGADSQMWLIEKHNRSYTVSCYSGTQRRFLSHGCGGLSFQNICFGANELWKLAE